MVTGCRLEKYVESMKPVEQRLTNIFVRKFMAKTYTLRLVLNGFAIHNGMTKLLNDRLVNCIALG